MEVPANYSQKKFLKLKQKFRGFVGGYGSGKTFAGCMAMILHAFANPGVPQGYFAPTYPQIRDIFYPTIEECAHLFGLQVEVKTSDHIVHLRSGPWYYGNIKCRSMEKPETIVGFKVGNALVDELDTLGIDKGLKAWRKIIGRLRVKQDGVKNGIDVVTTPEGFRSVHKMFVDDPSIKPHLLETYGIVQASTFENSANLPDDYIQSLIDTYPDELISAYINGQFVNLTSGTVYYAFDRKKHNSAEILGKKDVPQIGMDFNVGKMAAKIFVVRGKDEWHCVDEIYDVFDTPAMVDLLKERGIIADIYPDATGKNRKTVNASESDISLLEAAGHNVHTHKSNPFVKDRVMAVNKRFQENKLFVNVGKCPKTAKDLEQQAYDKNGEPEKKTGADHGNDSFGYPMAYLFPIVRPTHGYDVSWRN